MNRLIFNINAILLSMILLVAIPARGMDNELSLTNLPDDALMTIFPYCLSRDKPWYSYHYGINWYLIEPVFINDIKKLMYLSAMCSTFKRLLTFKTIGGFYKECPISIDYIADGLRYWMYHSSFPYRHKTFHSLALILTHANADANRMYMGTSFLKSAIQNSDEELFFTLIKHNADLTDLNMKKYGCHRPIFFYARTVKIAQELIDKGIDVHQTDEEGNNVLWHRIYDSPDILELYLQHQVNAKTLSPYKEICCSWEKKILARKGNSCLLHVLAKHSRYDNNAYDKSLSLLDVIPHMINHINANGQTPLDSAYKALKRAEKYYKKYNIEPDMTGLVEKLIALFKERGALTAQELAQKENRESIV